MPPIAIPAKTKRLTESIGWFATCLSIADCLLVPMIASWSMVIGVYLRNRASHQTQPHISTCLSWNSERIEIMLKVKVSQQTTAARSKSFRFAFSSRYHWRPSALNQQQTLAIEFEGRYKRLCCVERESETFRWISAQMWIKEKVHRLSIIVLYCFDFVMFIFIEFLHIVSVLNWDPVFCRFRSVFRFA